MEQIVLLCSTDASLHGIAGQAIQSLPSLDQVGEILPDVLLLDMDLLSDSPIDYLAEIADRYPSIQLLILADTKYQEEILFAALCFGCQGWVFKEGIEKTSQALKRLMEDRIFLKPSIAQLMIQEFKKFTKGEFLLAMEEEILQQCARGVALSEIRKNLNLNEKTLLTHWESIRQKLMINTRAKIVLETVPAMDEPVAHEKAPLPEKKLESQKNVEPVQVVTFFLESEEFAIGLTDLQEIERVMNITPLPNVPPSILGVVNLRGKIVPVIDLRIKLGMAASPLTKQSRIMIVNVGGTLAGLLVDSVKEVVQIEDDQVKAPPPLTLSVNDDFISGIMNLESRLVLLLDLKKTVAVR